MKRFFETLAVVVSFPLWAAAGLAGALAVLVFLGRPVFFSDERSGKGGVPFRMFKLRTMRPGTGPDAERTPPAGRILRKFSVDEIPQLWHVLTGEMAIVGPRPLPVRYLPRYSKVQSRRLEVRPGITGLAQVMGRNALTWEEKFAYDIEYVDRRSFWLDLKIIALTVLGVLRPRGVNASAKETMPEFAGGASGA